LIASEHQVASFYGRLGLLRWYWGRLDRSTPDPQMRSLLAEAGQLLDRYETLKQTAGNLRPGPKPLKKELIELHYEIYRTLTVADPTASRRRLAKVEPSAAYRYKPRPTPDAQVHFQEIELKTKEPTAGERTWQSVRWQMQTSGQPFVARLCRCGDQFDVFWGATGICFVRTVGLLDSFR